MRAISGAYTGEGGAVVFVPRGGGRFDLAAQLMPRDWQRLDEQYADH
jgi:hypothetical protein